MFDDRVPEGFKELDASFLRQQESIRDRIAVLLGDALHGCPDEQRVQHVKRASMPYESLAAMHGLLWGMLELAEPNANVDPRNHRM